MSKRTMSYLATPCARAAVTGWRRPRGGSGQHHDGGEGGAEQRRDARGGRIGEATAVRVGEASVSLDGDVRVIDEVAQLRVEVGLLEEVVEVDRVGASRDRRNLDRDVLRAIRDLEHTVAHRTVVVLLRELHLQLVVARDDGDGLHVVVPDVRQVLVAVDHQVIHLEADRLELHADADVVVVGEFVLTLRRRVVGALRPAEDGELVVTWDEGAGITALAAADLRDAGLQVPHRRAV
mmetsp:Transcript_18660/g.63568  ORF Transcript_18660/g.63568 Transcript_18660/m.63568 type:complete len:236 (-) Transcript_18660:368-1075(-)